MSLTSIAGMHPHPYSDLPINCCPHRDDGCESLVPANLLYAVWSELDYIAGYQQQDAHEFLIAFLDGMDQHLRQNHSVSSDNAGGVALANGEALHSGYSSSSPRKSPRTESKHRAFAFAAGAAVMLSPPPALRRSVSDNEPSSAGSVHYTPQCAEVLEVRPLGRVNSARLVHPLNRAACALSLQVFRGSLESNLTCRFCGHESVKRESFLDLSLSLSDCDRRGATAASGAGVDGDGKRRMSAEFAAASADGTTPELDRAADSLAGDEHCAADSEDGEERGITLADCLRSFTTLENLGEKIVSACYTARPSAWWTLTVMSCRLPYLFALQHCAGCARSQDMQKQLFISTPPNVLILHLKRFDMLTGTKVGCSCVR